MLLAELQAALPAAGLQSVVAGRHRLVLRYSEQPPHALSGETDPTLHIYGGVPDAITTDGGSYRLRSGREFPISEPGALVAALQI